MATMKCELARLLSLRGDCGLHWAGHHIISRQKVRGNKEAWKLIDKKYQHVFVVEACNKHHSIVHNYGAIKELLQKRIQKMGELYIIRILNEVCDTSKGDYLKEFRPEAIL